MDWTKQNRSGIFILFYFPAFPPPKHARGDFGFFGRIFPRIQRLSRGFQRLSIQRRRTTHKGVLCDSSGGLLFFSLRSFFWTSFFPELGGSPCCRRPSVITLFPSQCNIVCVIFFLRIFWVSRHDLVPSPLLSNALHSCLLGLRHHHHRWSTASGTEYTRTRALVTAR